jgi:hypothetical protein
MLLPLLIVLIPQTPQAFSAASAPAVKVDFTQVPGCGGGSESQGNIGGVVTGLDSPERYKVVIYAHTDWWYVQPLADSPYTRIGADGKWGNWTHLGQRYAALVVKDSFSPPATVQGLPEKDVIAVEETSCHS